MAWRTYSASSSLHCQLCYYCCDASLYKTSTPVPGTLSRNNIQQVRKYNARGHHSYHDLVFLCQDNIDERNLTLMHRKYLGLFHHGWKCICIVLMMSVPFNKQFFWGLPNCTPFTQIGIIFSRRQWGWGEVRYPLTYHELIVPSWTPSLTGIPFPKCPL